MKNYNLLYLQRITALENKHVPSIFREIKAFRKSFIQDFKERGKEYAINRLQQTNVNEGLSAIIQDIYSNAGVFGARLVTMELRDLLTQKDRPVFLRYKAGGFGRNERWIEAVASFLKLHLLRLVSAITETMRNDILKVLERAAKESLSIEETVRELQEEGLMRSRARVIARTEIVRAANVGHAVGASDTPYEVDKKWNAAKDHRTRDSHRLMHGKTVEELETFTVPIYEGDKRIGEEPMLYPGDANASAGNTINCRCRATYVPRRDANGNLVMRQTQPGGATVIPMNSAPSYTPAQIAAILKSNVVIRVD